MREIVEALGISFDSVVSILFDTEKWPGYEKGNRMRGGVAFSHNWPQK